MRIDEPIFLSLSEKNWTKELESQIEKSRPMFILSLIDDKKIYKELKTLLIVNHGIVS